MKYWLMKSEPSAYSWAQLLADGHTDWNGVRNYQANNNMKAMRVGDRAFFYHSNEQRAIVGMMEITALWRPDPADESGRFGMVTVAPLESFAYPVGLAAIKAHPLLSEMVFVRQGRLSVSPVAAEEWRVIVKMGKIGR
jgi:predicted RNA-binding protein with PUA-like domain